jgi:hypothetical protein
MQQIQIPPDFPRAKTHGAIGGAMPKVLLKKHDGKYFTGQSDHEYAQRYDICVDLVAQLIGYCQRKARENPDWSSDFNVSRAERGLRDKVVSGQWDFSSSEISWIVGRVKANYQNPSEEGSK